MTRTRIALLGAMIGLLVLLQLWAHHRETLIAECVVQGGIWEGPRSRCLPGPRQLLIDRGLRRSQTDQ